MGSHPHDLTISAVLPAFNEVEIITRVVRRVHTALVDAGITRFEAVVVDDGSSDGTGDAVEALGRELPEVRVVRHPHNRGYGAALRTGFEAASLDLVWLLDSDGQFDPADLPILLDAWRPNAYVIGYRAHRSDSLLRRLNHDAFFAVVRLALGRTVRDVNCAFRLFPRALGLGLTSDGAVVSTEMALRAKQARLPVIEVPVRHLPRTTGNPTGARPGVVIKAFAELMSLRGRMRQSPWPGLARVGAEPAAPAAGVQSAVSSE